MKNNSNNMIMMIIVAVVIAAVGFFGGMQYEKGKASTITNAAGGQFAGGPGGPGRQGGGRFGGRGGGAGAIVGQIVSADSNSITVKLSNGSSKIVNISGNTKISKSDTATMSDLTTGAQVAAFGTPNSDGSITATAVQLNPQMMRRPTGNGSAQSTTPSQSTTQY